MTKDNLTIISKPHAHLHTMKKTRAKFQNDQYKTERGVGVVINWNKLLTLKPTELALIEQSFLLTMAHCWTCSVEINASCRRFCSWFILTASWNYYFIIIAFLTLHWGTQCTWKQQMATGIKQKHVFMLSMLGKNFGWNLEIFSYFSPWQGLFFYTNCLLSICMKSQTLFSGKK